MPWPERRAALQADDTFSLSGRVGVAADGQGFNASLRWEQEGARSRVALDGPFGVGGALIESDGSELTLTDARGRRVDGEAARLEIERRLGFELPLAALRYWVRGVPVPDTPAAETLDAAAARLATLEQDGWRIEFTAYAPTASVELPQRLTAQREGTRVRMVIDRWE